MELGTVGIREVWWTQFRAQYRTTSQMNARRVIRLSSEEEAWILTIVAVHRVVVLLAVLVIISMPKEASY
jgi:hypothetical protein